MVTAVANAQRAGIPMIVFGGAGPRALADMGSLQDMNHVELMRPITKWSVSVPSTDRIAEYIDAAFRIAQGNVPGVSGSTNVTVPYAGPMEPGMYYQFRATSWRVAGGKAGAISNTEDLRGVFYVTP